MFLLPLVVPLENRMDCGFVSLQTGKCHGFLHQDLVQEQNRLGVIYGTVSLLSASCFPSMCCYYYSCHYVCLVCTFVSFASRYYSDWHYN